MLERCEASRSSFWGRACCGLMARNEDCAIPAVCEPRQIEGWGSGRSSRQDAWARKRACWHCWLGQELEITLHLCAQDGRALAHLSATKAVESADNAYNTVRNPPCPLVTFFGLFASSPHRTHHCIPPLYFEPLRLGCHNVGDSNPASIASATTLQPCIPFSMLCQHARVAGL